MPSTRILLVDDDEVIRSTLGELLQQQEFQVTGASNVPEALKLISSNVYDVLLSDLHMPGAGDGLTVVSAMHDLTVAGLYADRLVLLAAGEVVASGPAREVLTAETLRVHYGADVTVSVADDGTVVVIPRRTTRL